VPPPAIPEPVAKAPVAAPPKPLTKAPAAPPPSSPLSRVVGFGWSGSNPWLTLGIVGGAALLLLIVIALLLRRSRSTSLDALEMARERTGAIGAVDAFETPVGAGAQEGAMPRRGEAPAMAPGIFDEEFEKGEGEMGMEAAFPIERERARGAGAGVDSAVAPAVRELELRVAQLESRLEQMNEARERLERQVGAQSEELRVQRAAIARTQRALRGMTRSGEEQATEPALRDPGKPTPGRM
jgi:TolA-binding protein